jgi:hemerythrin superfamily protein
MKVKLILVIILAVICFMNIMYKDNIGKLFASDNKTIEARTFYIYTPEGIKTFKDNIEVELFSQIKARDILSEIDNLKYRIEILEKSLIR